MTKPGKVPERARSAGQPEAATPPTLGSTGFATDATGEVYQHLEYFPFGETWVNEVSDDTRVPYRFTGQELDQETKLYYYGARYYDPKTSVWQNPDPALGSYLQTGKLSFTTPHAGNGWRATLGGPGRGGAFEPKNLALASYGAQNPLRFIDPDGRQALEPWTATTVETAQPHAALPPAPQPDNGGRAAIQPRYRLQTRFVPQPSQAVGDFLNCLGECAGQTLTVTATTNGHPGDNPHSRGEAVDVLVPRPEDRARVMQCGANCGAPFQIDEYAHPSPGSTGGHEHFNMVPGRGGATGPYHPQTPPDAPQAQPPANQMRRPDE